MAKKFWSIALLLLVVLLIGLTGCGEKSKKTDTKKPSAELAKTSESVEPTQVVPVSDVVEEKTEVRTIELSSAEFGRENPFQPLGIFAEKSKLSAYRANIIQENEARLAPKAVAKNVSPPQKAKTLPNVKLSLVIDGNTAIFEDSYNSKVVSIGDSVAGMKIVEIRNSEAILDGGDKRYKVALGGGVEELSSPASKASSGVRKPENK